MGTYLRCMTSRGVQSAQTKQIKTKQNRNIKNGLDLIVPNIPNGCYF